MLGVHTKQFSTPTAIWLAEHFGRQTQLIVASGKHDDMMRNQLSYSRSHRAADGFGVERATSTVVQRLGDEDATEWRSPVARQQAALSAALAAEAVTVAASRSASDLLIVQSEVR